MLSARLRPLVTIRTEVAEQHGEEDESVRQPQKRDHQVQPEEEDLDELRFCKRQHEDAREVGHGDASKHLQETARVS